MLWDRLTVLLINLAITLIVGLITFVYNKIKSKMSERARTVVENIARVVEQLYDGCPSSEKLDAFRELAKKKGLNVEQAVNYLETHIIPTSKALNVFKADDNGTDDAPEITD